MRRVIAGALAALLCLGLAACRKDIPPLRPDETTAGEPIGTPPEKAIHNNGGRFVKYGGDTYYWEYNAACLEPSGIWGEFAEVPGIRRSIMRLKANGTQEGLFIESGRGDIWIYGGRFYLTWLDSNYTPQIYSTAMERGNAAGDARDRRDLGAGEIFALDEARGLLITSVGRLNGHQMEYGICVIDTRTSERTDLPVGDAEPMLYDAASAALYYRDKSAPAWEAIRLCRVDVTTGEVREVATIGTGGLEGFEDTDAVEFDSVALQGDSLHVFLSGYSGNAHMLMGSAYLVVDLVGDGIASRPWEDGADALRYGLHRVFAYEGQWYMCTGEDQWQPLLMVEELGGLGMPVSSYYTDEGFADVRHVEYVDGALFFSILRGPRNPEEDIGWREAYDFGSMHTYYKDISTGRIEELYSFDKDSLRG